MNHSNISPTPWGTMAGAPWNVLDATGRRIAWCNGDDYQRPSTAEDEANASLMAEAPEWQRKALVLLDELGSNILNQHDLLKAAAWVIECWGQPEDKYIHPDMGKAIERLAAEAQKLREAVDRVRQANPDYDLPSASAES